MIHLFELYELFLSNANTYQGGHVKPKRVFEKWLKAINLELYNELVDEFQKNRASTDRLTPFLLSVNVEVKPDRMSGYAIGARPKHYNRFCDARFYEDGGKFHVDPDLQVLCSDEKVRKCTETDFPVAEKKEGRIGLSERHIDFVDNDRWGSVLDHAFMQPTMESPVMSLFDKGFRVSPDGISVFVLDFFRLPKDPVFNYRITNPGTEDEYMEFVEDGSQHLEWPEDMIPEFIKKLMPKYEDYVRQQSNQ